MSNNSSLIGSKIRGLRETKNLSVEEIEKSGKTLVDIVKERYDYRADRINKAITEMQ